jgi:ABC-type branched-subunit amino acid transport system substrate-binding protein
MRRESNPMTEADPVRASGPCDRRGFFRHAAALAGCALLTDPRVAGAAEWAAAAPDDVLQVGFIAPPGGPGPGARRGARLGAEEAAQALALLGGRFRLHEATAAESGTVKAEAERLVRAHRVFGLVGGFDLPAAAVLGEVARELGVLFLNVGCAADRLRGGDCDRRTFHVTASDAMARDALELWRREAPTDAPPPGAPAVEGWHPALERFGAGQLNDRFRGRFDVGMDADGWASWMAVKVLWEAATRSRTSEAGALARFLEGGRARFDGHKGMPLSFRPWDHRLRQPLYVVARAAPPAESGVLLGEVPRARAGDERGWIELLDQLGSHGDGVPCAVAGS